MCEQTFYKTYKETKTIIEILFSEYKVIYYNFLCSKYVIIRPYFSFILEIGKSWKQFPKLFS